MQLSHDRNKVLAVTRKIEKFLIFLALKPIVTRTDCKGILGFIKKNLSSMQALRATLTLAIMA